MDINYSNPLKNKISRKGKEEKPRIIDKNDILEIFANKKTNYINHKSKSTFECPKNP